MKYIDLGLPSGTLWADCNIGANEPQEFGDYFNFDDIQNYGTVPTMWQMYELINYATHIICKVEGISGMCFIGKNGNSIFMPFAGFSDFLSNHTYVGYYGYWWTCSSGNSYAYSLYLDYTGSVNTSCCNRVYYLSVRLIKNK